MYDFDKVINRKGTESLKWNCPPACQSEEYKDIISMWIADNDFASPPEVVAALEKRARHPIYGYAKTPDDMFAAYIAWMKKRHALDLRPETLCFSPGIVPAIAIAMRAFSSEKDGVVIMPPVYHPFKAMIEKNKRSVVEAPLIIKNGRYELDFAAVDAACARAKILVMCSPHNPVGRVWTQAELNAIGDIVCKRNVILVSDEIHGDLVFERGRMISALALPEAVRQRLIAAWAPSKTFNIAGLQASIIVVPNPELKKTFGDELSAAAISSPNCMAASAAVAAYTDCATWLDEMLAYVGENYKTLVSRLAGTKLTVCPLEGTLLAWIDFRRAGLTGNVGPELIEKAGLWLDAGSRFGTGGDGFARLNMACPRSVLNTAIDRLLKAFA